MTIKVNKEPRFSVNKLGEYLTAKPARRKKIIYDKQYPKPFQGTVGYKEAREAIIKYISKDYDESIILDAIETIKKSTVLKDNEIENSITALKTILKADLPDLSKVKKTRYKATKEYLNIEGVDISVYPNLILRKGDKVGCINLHIIKTESNRLSKEASKHVTTVQHKFLETYVCKDGETVNPLMCISIDCFGNSHEIGTKAFSRRLSNIQTACEEIVLWWDSL